MKSALIDLAAQRESGLLPPRKKSWVLEGIEFSVEQASQFSKAVIIGMVIACAALVVCGGIYYRYVQLRHDQSLAVHNPIVMHPRGSLHE